MEIQGFGTKTITIPIVQNQQQYRLAEQQRLGLPAGAKVLGFAVRCNFEGADCKSINGKLLIPISAIVAGALNLKGPGTTTYLANCNLFSFVNVPDIQNVAQVPDFQIYQAFIEPVFVEDISWNKSNVYFSREAATNIFENSMDFEIIVLYCVDYVSDFPPPTQTYLGKKLCAYKSTTIEINLPSVLAAPNKVFVPLTIDGKSNIDTTDIVFGFRALQFQYQTSDNKVSTPYGTLNASFFTFKVGRAVILDICPVNCLSSNMQLGIPYFPVVPTLAGMIDWQSSGIDISDNQFTGSDDVISIQVFHYTPKDKK